MNKLAKPSSSPVPPAMESLSKKECLRRALFRLPVQTNYTGVMASKLTTHFRCSTKELAGRLDNHMLRVDVSHTPCVSTAGWRQTTLGKSSPN